MSRVSVEAKYALVQSSSEETDYVVRSRKKVRIRDGEFSESRSAFPREEDWMIDENEDPK